MDTQTKTVPRKFVNRTAMTGEFAINPQDLQSASAKTDLEVNFAKRSLVLKTAVRTDIATISQVCARANLCGKEMTALSLTADSTASVMASV